MEKIIAIVPELRIAKIFSNEMYTLIVTNERSIFANLTKEMLNDMYKKAREDAKAQGKGFFGQWGAQLGTAFSYSDKYSKMKPDEILKEAPKNFEIKNSEIEKVKYKWFHDEESARNYYEVIFKTTSNKHKFKTEKDPKAGLKKAYEDKVKSGLF